MDLSDNYHFDQSFMLQGASSYTLNDPAYSHYAGNQEDQSFQQDYDGSTVPSSPSKPAIIPYFQGPSRNWKVFESGASFYMHVSLKERVDDHCSYNSRHPQIPSNSPESIDGFRCEVCNKGFKSSRGKGGHMSRAHPKTSKKYGRKLWARKWNKKKRESRLILQQAIMLQFRQIHQ